MYVHMWIKQDNVAKLHVLSIHCYIHDMSFCYLQSFFLRRRSSNLSYYYLRSHRLNLHEQAEHIILLSLYLEIT